MTLPDNAAFRIGDWRVDPALDEISRDGRTVKLEPRTMRVLVCLARRAGEVVSVDDLLNAVWIRAFDVSTMFPRHPHRGVSGGISVARPRLNRLISYDSLPLAPASLSC
jgi:hypothetical protein